MSETKTITYFEAFRCAAKHFYGATDLTKYIEDTDCDLIDPSVVRKNAFENSLQLRILHDEHTNVIQTLKREENEAEKEKLAEKRNSLQMEIEFRSQDIKSPFELVDYETRYSAKLKALSISDKILEAIRQGKLEFRLESGERLSIENMTDRTKWKFYPKESMGKFIIMDSERSGIVVTDEKTVSDWLIGQDIMEGKFDTPEKRKIRCEQLYRARLSAIETAELSKDAQFKAISKDIPGLQRSEFEAVRVQLRLEFPSIGESGRPPKSTHKSK